MIDRAGRLRSTNAAAVAILADTDVIDDATSGLVKIAADVAAVLVDTNTTVPATLTAQDAVLEYLKAVGGYWTTVSDTDAGTIIIKDSLGATLRTVTFVKDGTERTGTGS